MRNKLCGKCYSAFTGRLQAIMFLQAISKTHLMSDYSVRAFSKFSSAIDLLANCAFSYATHDAYGVSRLIRLWRAFP